MRQSLFAGLRLRSSYRNVPLDAILALLDRTDEQEEDFSDSCCFHHPRRLRALKKEEEL